MHNVFSLPLVAIVLVVLALASFFFALTETAIIGLNKIRLRHMIKRGIKGAAAVQNLVMKLDKVIAAVLIGNNFVNIAISTIVTAIFVHLFGYKIGVIFATFTTTFSLLILCEITPKILATKHAEVSALFAAPVMEFLIKVFNPVILIFTGLSNLLLRIFGMEISKRSPLITQEELRTMIEVGKEEGVLSDEERKMLHRIFEFGDIRVKDVMIPKDKVVAVDINIKADELLDIFVEQGHARLPVYKGSVDNIIGVIFARDLLYILRDKGLFVLQDLLHEAYFVSGAMRVNELLRRFQTDRVQIAIVVDSNKVSLGVVTLEDLVEEIVGEIEEEHHRRILKKH